MADRNRSFAVALIALPLLFLAMPGLASAATITVDTLSPTSVTGHCNLSDAIAAANGKTGVQGCAAGTGTDTIDFSLSGTITLTSSLPAIAINLTIDGRGQAITVDGASSFQILSVNPGATLNLQNLTIAHGFSSGDGGGIDNTGTLTVTNITFYDNSADEDGGGIYNEVGTLTVANSTFSDNSAGDGGGIDSFGTLTVTNSTFYGNSAIGFGGGIENAGTTKVTNSTFSGNNADSVGTGGGIDNAVGSTTLKSTILAGSLNGSGNCAGFGTPPVTDAGYNISDDGTCDFSGTSINNSTTLHLDPAGLANNGGPTQTIALEPNSEAVDFIPVADCTDQSSPTPLPLTTDQRGFPRPDPGNPDFCDAGAFELQTTPFVLALNSERLQIARSTKPDSDQVNLAFTFTENGFPMCDAGDDAFNGFTVLLRSGSCGLLDDGSLELMLEPWVVHTVNHQSYGTLFQSTPPETVSARMVQLPTPASPACGEWTVNIEVAGIDSSDLGNGPFALILSNPDGDTDCFDITNAIVGNQIDPPTRTVRRGVRR
jgi:hypothetical protein